MNKNKENTIITMPVSSMLNVIIPQETEKIYRQIKEVKEILQTDDKNNDDVKSAKILMQVLIRLEKTLIADFVCKEWYKLSYDVEEKICFTQEMIDNKNVHKIIEVLKTRAYINHVYYQLAVKRLQECFDNEDGLITSQEIASYYLDMMDLFEDILNIDDIELRMEYGA